MGNHDNTMAFKGGIEAVCEQYTDTRDYTWATGSYNNRWATKQQCQGNKWATMTILWHLKGELRYNVSNTLPLMIIYMSNKQFQQYVGNKTVIPRKQMGNYDNTMVPTWGIEAVCEQYTATCDYIWAKGSYNNMWATKKQYLGNKLAIMTIEWHLKGELRQYVSNTLPLMIIYEQQAVIICG